MFFFLICQSCGKWWKFPTRSTAGHCCQAVVNWKKCFIYLFFENFQIYLSGVLSCSYHGNRFTVIKLFSPPLQNGCMAGVEFYFEGEPHSVSSVAWWLDPTFLLIYLCIKLISISIRQAHTIHTLHVQYLNM